MLSSNFVINIPPRMLKLILQFCMTKTYLYNQEEFFIKKRHNQCLLFAYIFMKTGKNLNFMHIFSLLDRQNRFKQEQVDCYFLEISHQQKILYDRRITVTNIKCCLKIDTFLSSSRNSCMVENLHAVVV